MHLPSQSQDDRRLADALREITPSLPAAAELAAAKDALQSLAVRRGELLRGGGGSANRKAIVALDAEYDATVQRIVDLESRLAIAQGEALLARVHAAETAYAQTLEAMQSAAARYAHAVQQVAELEPEVRRTKIAHENTWYAVSDRRKLVTHFANVTGQAVAAAPARAAEHNAERDRQAAEAAVEAANAAKARHAAALAQVAELERELAEAQRVAAGITAAGFTNGQERA
jgi:hypothetical protein